MQEDEAKRICWRRIRDQEGYIWQCAGVDQGKQVLSRRVELGGWEKVPFALAERELVYNAPNALDLIENRSSQRRAAIQALSP